MKDPHSEKKNVNHNQIIYDYQFILQQQERWKGISINDPLICSRTNTRYMVRYIDPVSKTPYVRRILQNGELGKILHWVCSLDLKEDPEKVDAIILGKDYDPQKTQQLAGLRRQALMKQLRRMRLRNPLSNHPWDVSPTEATAYLQNFRNTDYIWLSYKHNDPTDIVQLKIKTVFIPRTHTLENGYIETDGFPDTNNWLMQGVQRWDIGRLKQYHVYLEKPPTIDAIVLPEDDKNEAE